jgi:hypothetical protein
MPTLASPLTRACSASTQLTDRGLDATGAKPELSARVKAARSGKPLPAAAACASRVRTPDACGPTRVPQY